MSGLSKLVSGVPLLYKIGGAVVGVILLLGALALLLRSCDAKDQRIENKLEQKGAQTERLRENEEVINAVQNAQRPVTDRDRNIVCSRYDRNRSANCP